MLLAQAPQPEMRMLAAWGRPGLPDGLIDQLAEKLGFSPAILVPGYFLKFRETQQYRKYNLNCYTST
jgi:hypothetical protein